MGEVLKKIKSTQSDLKERLSKNPELENFYWIQAEEQTDGRGRQNRQWISPSGNLYLSVLIRNQTTDITWMPHRVALAMYATVVNLGAASQKVRIKWPNDLVWAGENERAQKFGGVICEKIGTNFVAGVGINVLTVPKIEIPATSLYQIIGKTVDLNKVRDEFLKNITAEFKASSDSSRMYMMNYIGAQYFKPGQKITWDSGDGKFVKIGNYGELIVQMSTREEKSLFSEDVHLLS